MALAQYTCNTVSSKPNWEFWNKCRHKINDNDHFCSLCYCIHHDQTNVSSIIPYQSHLTIIEQSFQEIIHTFFSPSKEPILPHSNSIMNINRSSILDKIGKTIFFYNYSQFSYYLAIYIFDWFTRSHIKTNSTMNHEQLALSSIFLSIKYIELDSTIPNLKEIENIFAPAKPSSVCNLRKSETLVLKELKHFIRYFTPYDYLDLYYKSGILFNHETTNKADYKIYNEIMQIKQRGNEWLENIIKNSNKYLEYKAKDLAWAIICTVREEFYYSFYNELFYNAYKIAEHDWLKIGEYINNVRKKINGAHSEVWGNNKKSLNISGSNDKTGSRRKKSLMIANNNSATPRRKTITVNTSSISSISTSVESQKIKKSYYRSSSGNTSSEEVHLTLKKIKEQSKKITTELYSVINSNMKKINNTNTKSNIKTSKETNKPDHLITNNSTRKVSNYKEGNEKLRNSISILKASLNYSIIYEKYSSKHKEWNNKNKETNKYGTTKPVRKDRLKSCKEQSKHQNRIQLVNTIRKYNNILLTSTKSEMSLTKWKFNNHNITKISTNWITVGSFNAESNSSRTNSLPCSKRPSLQKNSISRNWNTGIIDTLMNNNRSNLENSEFSSKKQNSVFNRKVKMSKFRNTSYQMNIPIIFSNNKNKL